MKYSAAVITVSDKCSSGERTDTSGPAVCEAIKARGFELRYTSVIPDEPEMIKRELIKCADELGVSLVLTTGGTGFSPRDVTPEATLAVVEREARGIPEAMRAESMRITPRGCLSRGAAGIRGRTLIVNLPGSEKAALENLSAVAEALCHGMDMLASGGSANRAGTEKAKRWEAPSLDAWLKEAKAAPEAAQCGMFLFHNGTVRRTAKAMVRENAEGTAPVSGMYFSYDAEKVDAAIKKTRAMLGIYYVRVWLNEGRLELGDDIMLVLVGGDIRPHVIDALQSLVGEIKQHCVVEKEIY